MISSVYPPEPLAPWRTIAGIPLLIAYFLLRPITTPPAPTASAIVTGVYADEESPTVVGGY